jgi:hypothetical protein
LYTGDQLRVFVEFPGLARTGTMESEGKAAEIAGLTRADFLEALFRANVRACQINVEELNGLRGSSTRKNTSRTLCIARYCHRAKAPSTN